MDKPISSEMLVDSHERIKKFCHDEKVSIYKLLATGSQIARQLLWPNPVYLCWFLAVISTELKWESGENELPDWQGLEGISLESWSRFGRLFAMFCRSGILKLISGSVKDNTRPNFKQITAFSVLILAVSANAKYCGTAPTISPCPAGAITIPAKLALYNDTNGGLIQASGLRLTQVVDPQGSLTHHLCTHKATGLYDPGCQKECSELLCDGDQSYCSVHQCDQASMCTCRSVRYRNQLECYTDGWVPCSGPTWFNVSYIAADATGTKRHVKLNGPRKREACTETKAHVYVRERVLTIELEQKPTKTIFITMRKEGFSKVIESAGRETKTELSDLLFMRSGELSVTITNHCGLSVKKSVEITAEALCRVPDCLLCFELYGAFGCLPWRHQLLLVVVSVFYLLSILACIPTVILWVSVVFKYCIYKPGKCLFYCCCCNKVSKMARDRIIDIRRQMADEEAPRQTQYVRRGAMGPSPIIFLALLLLPFCLACDRTTTISTLSSQCQVGGSDRTCSLITTSLVYLNFPGSTSCLDFNTPEGELLAKVELSFSKVTDMVSGELAYFTSDWDGVYGRSLWCFNTDKCNDNLKCAIQYTDSWNKTTPIGWSSELLLWPGASNCDRIQGGWAYGCFFEVDRCAWSVFSIVPKGEVAAVYNLVNRVKRPEVTVKVTSSNGTVISQGTATVTGQWVRVGGVDIKLEGLLNGQESSFGDKRMVRKGGNVYIGYASTPNVPNPQVIGDIQATTASKLATPARDSFILNREMIRKVTGANDVGYSFSNPGMRNLATTAVLLPSLIDGDLWSSNEAVITSEMTNPGTVSITVEMLGEIKVTQNYHVVCPELTINSASGCFNCDEGVVIKVSARSACSSGSAVVTADDPLVIIDTSSVILSTELEEYDIHIRTPKASNSWALTLSSGQHKDTKMVSFTATEKVILREDKEIRPPDESLSGWAAFSGIFRLGATGSGAWWQTLVFWLLIGMLAALAAYLSVVLWRKIRSGSYIKLKEEDKKGSKSQ